MMPSSPMGPHIVAIDDSDIALEVIRATLSEFGFDQVTAFDSPVEALDALDRAAVSPDLILMDVMMPEMDGVELCARVRALETTQDVPIVMLTSRRDMDTLSQAFIAGASDYVTKPFDRIELEARIRSCLRLKSELDRRKTSEQMLFAAAERAAPRSAHRVSAAAVVASSSEFDAAVNGLNPSDLPDLTMIAMLLARNPNRRGMPGYGTPPVVPRSLPEVLGRVDMPAGGIFAPFGEGLYCCATLRLTREEVEALALRFRRAVHNAGFRDPADPDGAAFILRTAIASPGTAGPPGPVLADAIRRLQLAD